MDVLIVGAGACGLWAAKTLTEAGLAVTLVEAGDATPPERADPSAPNPNQTIDHDTSTPFSWVEHSGLGGRMRQWGRICFRMADFDFKAPHWDGHGVAWPFDYNTIRPHYERIERFLALRGEQDHLEQLPDSVCSQPLPFSRAEQHWQQKLNLAGCPEKIIHPRVATHGAPDILAAAIRTGRLTIYTQCRVVSLLQKKDEVIGVEWIDLQTQQRRQQTARIVMLAASTLETIRLLLFARGVDGANGLGNHSGLLGRHLMDHVAADVVLAAGAIRDTSLLRANTRHEPGYGICIPRTTNLGATHENFLRGYALFGMAGRGIPENPPPHLQPFVDALNQENADAFWFQVWGEMLSHPENSAMLSNCFDQWGVPKLRIHFRYGANEHTMRTHQLNTIQKLVDIVGYELIYTCETLATPGTSIHEVGGARMGLTEEDSVVNPYGQIWGTQNVYVIDGSVFPSCPPQNPTLTMLAIADRTCQHILTRMGRREFSC